MNKEQIDLAEVCEAYEGLIAGFSYRARLTAGEIRSLAEAVNGLEPHRQFAIRVVAEQYERAVLD